MSKCPTCSREQLSREDAVLLKVARSSGPSSSTILRAIDLPVARNLVQAGLLTCGPFDDWFNLTNTGSARAQEIARQN